LSIFIVPVLGTALPFYFWEKRRQTLKPFKIPEEEKTWPMQTPFSRLLQTFFFLQILNTENMDVLVGLSCEELVYFMESAILSMVFNRVCMHTEYGV
jgi:hypothetical protein